MSANLKRRKPLRGDKLAEYMNECITLAMGVAEEH